MDQYNIIATIIALISVFSMIYSRMQNQKDTRDQKTIKALWEKVDVLRVEHTKLIDRLYDNYMTKDDIREHIKLTSQPILDKLKHVDTELGSIKRLLENYLKPNMRT